MLGERVDAAHMDRALFGHGLEIGAAAQGIAAPGKPLLELIERPQDNLVMNCGYGKGLSVLEVLDAVDRLTSTPVKRVIEGRRSGDPPELVADNRRLLETLDWRPAHADIESIVGDALAWERKLPGKAA